MPKFELEFSFNGKGTATRVADTLDEALDQLYDMVSDDIGAFADMLTVEVGEKKNGR